MYPSVPPTAASGSANNTSASGSSFCASGGSSCNGQDTTVQTPNKDVLPAGDLNVKCDANNPSGSNSIMCKFVDIINFLSIGVGIVATITVAVSGFQYMASRGDPNKTAQAVSRLVQVAIAIALYVFGWAIINWLIPGGAF